MNFFGKLIKRLNKEAQAQTAVPAQQQQHSHLSSVSLSDSGGDSDGSIVAPGMGSQGPKCRARRAAFSRGNSRLSDSKPARSPHAEPTVEPTDSSSSHGNALVEPRRSNSVDGKALDGKELRSSRRTYSVSVADEPVGRLYRQLRPMHRGRNCKLLEGVERKSSSPVVIKVFCKKTQTATQREMMEREVEILRKAQDCPSVVKLLGTVQDNENSYTVLERCQGQTLIELVASCQGRLSERRCAIEIAAPLVQAIAQLHELGIVHRNLKPEHVICSIAGLKLIDLFEAGDTKVQCLNHRTGIKEYMAPEVLNKPRAEDIFHQVLFNGMAEEELPQYDEKADLWSIGVVVFEALTGCQPFQGDSIQELISLQESMLGEARVGATVATSTPEFVARCKMSPGAEDFLAQLFQLDPAKRPSAAKLLQHTWLSASYHRYSSMQLQQSRSGSPFQASLAESKSSTILQVN